VIRALLALLLWAGAAGAQGISAHGGPVRALAVGPAGAASGGLDQAVIFWGLDGRPRLVARWHQGAVEALIAIPGAGFASGGEDGLVAIWPATGATQPDMVLRGHQGPVTALASNGDAIASGGFDATVREADGQGAMRVFEGHRGPVSALAYTTRGLVSGGQDGTLRRWPEGEVLADFSAPVTALAATPGGLVAGLANGTLHLLGPGMGEFSTGTRPVAALAWQGSLLAAAGSGGNVGIWDRVSGRLLRVLEGPGLPVWSAGFGPDGMLWTGGMDSQIRRWNPTSGRPLSESAATRPTIPEGADAHGARVFRACQACHGLTADAAPMAGPSLHGIFGRRMGSLAGYTYSERLARGDIIWNAETLADLFTRGPDVVTPGTRMPVQRLSDSEDLAALLRFLATATR
jgi:cytochrome c